MFNSQQIFATYHKTSPNSLVISFNFSSFTVPPSSRITFLIFSATSPDSQHKPNVGYIILLP